MGAALKVVSEPRSAAVLLDPERNALVELLADPDSAAGLARKLGWSRQIVNYHLRELEKAGLVALVEERRKGNCMERMMRRTAQSYVIDPAVVGPLGVNPKAMADKLSASYLIAVAARTIKEVASMSGPAEASGKMLPTVTLDSVVRFRNAGERNAFVRELTGEMARLIGKYHAADAKDGRTFRITAGAYPIPKSEIEKESKSGNES
jgi:DNA-binding transcriptional ArsR family regulator